MPPTHCHRCERPMVPNKEWLKADTETRQTWVDTGRVRSMSRGLCTSCYNRLSGRRLGELADYARQTMPRGHVVEEWDHLKTQGAPLYVNLKRVAPRLGMSPKALDKALRRAGRIGEAA